MAQALGAENAGDPEQLAEELHLLGELPQARLRPNSVFDRARPPGSIPHLRGVIVWLRCCKKNLDQKCNAFEQPVFRKNQPPQLPCPTFIEAARFLRAKV